MCSEFDDDAIAIEALHAGSLGLLSGLDVSRIERALTREACEGSHWLVLYEGVRQGFFRKLSHTKSVRISRTSVSVTVRGKGLFCIQRPQPAPWFSVQALALKRSPRSASCQARAKSLDRSSPVVLSITMPPAGLVPWMRAQLLSHANRRLPPPRQIAGRRAGNDAVTRRAEEPAESV